MKAFDVFFWVVIILPVFVLFFSKIAYVLGYITSVIGSLFNLFTYFWVSCKLVWTMTEFFIVYFLWLVILFIYNKVKI